MGSYINARMVEIREQLGPALKELGVRPRTWKGDGCVVVEFLPLKSTGNFSPVAIVFDDKASTGLEEASWAHAHVYVADYRRRDVGDTGWIAIDKTGERRLAIRHEGQRMFEWIAFVLEYEGAFPYQVGAPMHLASPHVADAYATVASWHRDVRIERRIEHEMPVETLVFADKDERDIRIEYRHLWSDAHLVIDGELTERFSQHDFHYLNAVVRELADNFYADRNLWRAPR
ncbi:hypothetical protein [Rhizobium phaseoli]|uniref:hypothetical protein n=1 Tax=Rhizobium phaseoli TaxID=396 RepID=UPI000BE92DB0|nr:hypothetical protein [Rhizobium phaseoli]PDS28014.1 hypothetical protein CO650_28655 [Rhizobium phaseoli]